MCVFRDQSRRAWCVWVFVLCVFALAMSVAGQTDWRGEDNSRRLGVLEAQRLDARISVLERRLDTIENIGAGIFIVVLGQLGLSAVSFSVRKRARKEAEEG